jgi:arylsulfatase A-like enzyme
VRIQLLEQRWPWLVAAGIVVLILLSSFVDVQIGDDWDHRSTGSADDIAALPERQDLNVLFILVDTLRADRLGSYGYERDTSPTLDRLAATGVRFERHLAQSSWTKSSMASLWTGLYPQRTGITRYDDVVPADARMVAEVLREAGFQTVGLYRNGWVAPTFGFDQGFEVYQRPNQKPLPPEARRENPTLGQQGSDEGLVDAAVEFLRVNGDRRWFLYLHLMDLHEYVYDAESALFGSAYSDVYDNSIRWTDGTIQVLLEYLDSMGFLDKTLIAIASDHGEAFLERGFEGHARRVYREETEVPFLVSFPFRLEPGIVIESRTQNVDVWPTILDLIGLEPPPGIDGRSVREEILARAAGREANGSQHVAISDLDQNWGNREKPPMRTIAVVDDTLRYVRVEGPTGETVEQLFDARNDPAEMRDRSAESPEKLEQLRAQADAYTETDPTWGEAPTRELSELELNLLRALGYVIED